MNRRTVRLSSDLASRCQSLWPATASSHAPFLAASVTRVAAITYGTRTDDPSLVMSGVRRAEAMTYRDGRGQTTTDPDWFEIGAGCDVYRSLKMAVADGDLSPVSIVTRWNFFADTKKPRTLPGLLSC